MFSRQRPVVVVTGANGGIGFGVCHRLLNQLSRSNPSDSLPQPSLSSYFPARNDDGPAQATCDGLTLILACRNVKRGEDAREKLLDLLDTDIARQKSRNDYDGHADIFKKNLQIVVHYIDLGNVRSIFEFRNVLSASYPYVSHLICNAGVASFCGLDWLALFKQLLTNLVAAVTSPEYKLQVTGEISVDGLGYVWQCNVFGNYVLQRSLQPLLNLYFEVSSSPARVLWMSSIESIPSCYDPNDWQLIKNDHSYEGSKYQTDLLAAYLDEQARLSIPIPESVSEDQLEKTAQEPPIRHFVVHPGIAATNISSTAIGWWLVTPMVFVFYVARMLGSPHHPISPYKAAISAVHIAIASLTIISPSIPKPSLQNRNDKAHKTGDRKYQRPPLKFGSETNRWGHERVGATEVEDWEVNWDEAARITEKCERLYQTFLKAES